MRLQFDLSSATNSIGMFHESNQDSWFADPGGIFAVADGVGGYEGAEMASKEAVRFIAENGRNVDGIRGMRELINSLQRNELEYAKKLGLLGMGTTIVVAKVAKKGKGFRILTGNVGDSSAFLVRGERIKELSRGDSMRGMDPSDLFHLTQYIGLPGEIVPRISEASAERGEMLVLCSDGVTDNLTYAGNHVRFLESLKTRSAKKLVSDAMEAGLKPDDATAIIVFLDGSEIAERCMELDGLPKNP